MPGSATSPSPSRRAVTGSTSPSSDATRIPKTAQGYRLHVNTDAITAARETLPSAQRAVSESTAQYTSPLTTVPDTDLSVLERLPTPTSAATCGLPRRHRPRPPRSARTAAGVAEPRHVLRHQHVLRSQHQGDERGVVAEGASSCSTGPQRDEPARHPRLQPAEQPQIDDGTGHRSNLATDPAGEPIWDVHGSSNRRANCSGCDKNGEWLLASSRTLVGLPGVNESASRMNRSCAAGGNARSAVHRT